MLNEKKKSIQPIKSLDLLEVVLETSADIMTYDAADFTALTFNQTLNQSTTVKVFELEDQLKYYDD